MREDNLEEMKDWLGRLVHNLTADGKLRHQNSLTELEPFFCHLLNRTFGWQLADANTALAINQDSFDLFDDLNRIAVQVTVTTTAAKIRKTLKTFVSNHRNKYDLLKFVYPAFDIPKTSADFSSLLFGFDFNPTRDRLSFSNVMKQVQGMSIADQREVLDLLRQELKPLGKALQFGVDQTMETLISVIGYMSQSAPVHTLSIDDQHPDVQAKQERLKEHATSIFNQYKWNQQLHATIEQARQAIGCDAARIAKIQAWLKFRSNEALQLNGGDATRAIIDLARDLLEKAHANGTDAEESAVRFLLADEFIRCNVFPNPGA